MLGLSIFIYCMGILLIYWFLILYVCVYLMHAYKSFLCFFFVLFFSCLFYFGLFDLLACLRKKMWSWVGGEVGRNQRRWRRGNYNLDTFKKRYQVAHGLLNSALMQAILSSVGIKKYIKVGQGLVERRTSVGEEKGGVCESSIWTYMKNWRAKINGKQQEEVPS